MKRFSFSLCLLLVFLLPGNARADDIKVAIAFDGKSGRSFVSILPNGGLWFSKSGQITGKETFVMQNLNGAEITSGAQVKFRFSDSIFARTGDIINRTPARGKKDDLTVFELKDAGGPFKLMAPGGGWVGGPSDSTRRAFSVVENEEDALLVEFVLNPQGTN